MMKLKKLYEAKYCLLFIDIQFHKIYLQQNESPGKCESTFESKNGNGSK